MKLYKDNHNILCIGEYENTNKQYTQIVEWYTITDYDKTVIVEHKRVFKNIQFKDIGEKMSVCYITNRNQYIADSIKWLDMGWAVAALWLFKWFDENSNKKYAFLYKYPSNNINILNHQLTILGIKTQVHKTEKWLIVQLPDNANTNISFGDASMDAIISFLFVLSVLYGKLDIKQWLLHNCKIHIPLFGAYLKDQKIFDTILFVLESKGIFLQKHIQETNDGLIYQITSSDYEFLQAIAKLYKPIAKINKIPTLDRTQQNKELLLQYIDNLKIPGTQAIQTRNLIEQNIIKFLQK